MNVRAMVHHVRANKKESNNLSTVIGKSNSQHSILTLTIDALSLFPVEIFAPAVVGSVQLHAATMMRLNRLLRLSHVLRFLAQWERQLNANILQVQAITFVVVLSILVHWQVSTPLPCPHPSLALTQTDGLNAASLFTVCRSLTPTIYRHSIGLHLACSGVLRWRLPYADLDCPGRGNVRWHHGR
jgi:hypothetical protein